MISEGVQRALDRVVTLEELHDVLAYVRQAYARWTRTWLRSGL